MSLSILLNKKNICLLVLFLSFFASNSQDLFSDYKKSYPDYNEIILENRQVYSFSIEKSKLKIIQDNHKESMILTENGIQNNQESFTFSDLIKINNYDASTVLTKSGKEKKIKVTQTNEKSAEENSVFYSGVKQRQLIFPNLESGAKKVFNYQTEFLDPFLLQKFIFGGSLPIKESSLEINFEKNISVGYKIFNDPENTIVFSKSEKSDKNIYNWTLKDIKAIKYESNSPGFLHQIPHIVIYIKDFTANNKKNEVLEDEKRLFNYYRGFVKNLNKSEDSELKLITNQLIKDKLTDEEKVKVIFYWVKDNIKYIAFENGYEGFIPREASLIYQRKFGDCKDMASIITEMSKYANVKDVAISWIGTREIPYSYNDLATPAVDNHMIATYKKGDEYIFLDGTDKETRYGIPTAFIQGKEVMINESTGNFKIIQVPIVHSQKNESKDVVKIIINNDKIIGSGKLELNGFSRSHILSQIGDATSKTRFELIKSLVLKGNNKFQLTEDYTEENIKDRDKTYIVNYNFELENYVVKADKEMYINLFLDKTFEKLTIEKDRIAKYEFEFLIYNNNFYQLEIPKNYTVKYIPKNFNIDNDLFKVDFTYEVKNNILQLEVKIEIKKMLLEKSDFDLWNQSIKKIKENYTETIILTEK